eukprot:252506-Karenia_brevis.AAC.1
MLYNVISFSAAISACEKGGQWQRVAPSFDEMPMEALCLDVISFNAAISVCEKGWQWQHVAPSYDKMRREALSPD